MAALDPRQLKQLQNALLSAFPTKADLAQFVRFQLGEQLDSIAGGVTTSEIIFNLLRWAESHGRLEKLIQGARAERPQNPAVQAFIPLYAGTRPTSLQPTGPSTTQDAHSYVNRGFACYTATDYDAAIVDYTQAIRLQPDYALAYEHRGAAYFMRGRAYNRAHRTSEPNSKDYRRAIADYSNALRIQPTASLYCNRGAAFAACHDSERAIADYTAAIRLAPSNADAYYRRGVAYHRIGRYDLALVDLSFVIDTCPDYAPAYSARANTFRDLQRKGIWQPDYSRYGHIARADYRKVLELSNDAKLRRDTELALVQLPIDFSTLESLPAKKPRPWWQRLFPFFED